MRYLIAVLLALPGVAMAAETNNHKICGQYPST